MKNIALTIAAVRSTSMPQDVPGNVQTHLRFVEAAKQHSELAIMPVPIANHGGMLGGKVSALRIGLYRRSEAHIQMPFNAQDKRRRRPPWLTS